MHFREKRTSGILLKALQERTMSLSFEHVSSSWGRFARQLFLVCMIGNQRTSPSAHTIVTVWVSRIIIYLTSKTVSDVNTAIWDDIATSLLYPTFRVARVTLEYNLFNKKII